MSIGNLSVAFVGAGVALVLVWLALLVARRRLPAGSLAAAETRGMAFTANVAGVAGLSLAVVGAGLGVGFNAFGGAPPPRVPTPAEIAQANADFNAVNARCAALLAELNDERTRRLVSIPAAKTALDRLETSLRAAQAARLQAERAAADARIAAEARADQDQREANDTLDRALSTFDAEAERARIVERARADHDSRLREIDSSHSTLAERDQRRTASTETYQKEIAAADRTLNDRRDAVTRDHRKGYDATLTQAIAATQKARRDEQHAREAAEKGFASTVAAAHDAFALSIASLPDASADEAAIGEKRTATTAQCEQDRQAIFARLRAPR